MLEQSSTARTYTRDAYAPVRRDAHAELYEKRQDCCCPKTISVIGIRALTRAFGG